MSRKHEDNLSEKLNIKKLIKASSSGMLSELAKACQVYTCQDSKQCIDDDLMKSYEIDKKVLNPNNPI